MIAEYELNAEDVREMMPKRMEAHLSLKTDSYRSSNEETMNLLLKAVAEGSSLETACEDSCGVVDSNTQRVEHILLEMV